MNEQTFENLNKTGKIANVEKATEAEAEAKKTSFSAPGFGGRIEDYILFLNMLRQYKQHVTTAPAYIPRSFLEQIVLYNNGATYRVYFYVNGAWKYVALT